MSSASVKPPFGNKARIERLLATRGEGGYQQYRIPALAVTRQGTLLAAYDARPTLDDLPSPIDLVLRRSMDSGWSWEALQVVRTGAGLEGFGDPSLLVDADTGRIFLFHAAATTAGFFESEEGLAHTQHVDVSVSDDDGLTWTHRRLTGMLKRFGITGIFAASGQGAQIHAGPQRGRLLQPCVVLASGRIAAAVAFSDDHGDTWSLGDLVSTPHGPATNESAVAVLDDGTVVLHSRATPFRLVAESHDGGSSFGTLHPDPALPDPGDNGSLVRFDGAPLLAAVSGTGDWLLASHNSHRHLRCNTLLRLSRDGGRTWAGQATIYAGSSAYSTATRLPDGRIGVLYEREGYRDIAFASLHPEELEEPEASMRPGADGEETRPLRVETVLRSITPAPPQDWTFRDGHQELGGPAEGADSGFDPAERKEVGHGAGPQILASRRDVLANYGPPRTEIRPGDILTFSSAVTNTGTQTITDLHPSGSASCLEPARTLHPGETALWPHLNHTVNDAAAVTIVWSGLLGTEPFRIPTNQPLP